MGNFPILARWWLRGTWLVRSCMRALACLRGRGSVKLVNFPYGADESSCCRHLPQVLERRSFLISDFCFLVWCCMRVDLLSGSCLGPLPFLSAASSTFQALMSPSAVFLASASTDSFPATFACPGTQCTISLSMSCLSSASLMELI